MNIRSWMLFMTFLFVVTAGHAQIDSVGTRLLKIKDSDNDSLKVAYADEIPGLLEKTEFASYLKTNPVKYLGYKHCSNSETELFSWSIPLTTGVAYYNWFRFKEENKSYFLRVLPGEKTDIPPYYFYDLLAFKSDKRDYFVLLGWAQNPESNKKAICIARFDKGGEINFKSKLIRRGNKTASSFVFEYAKDGSMVLKYDKKGKRIIFDRLAPIDKKYEGYFMFYGPDGSNDALILKKGEWLYEEDVKRER